MQRSFLRPGAIAASAIVFICSSTGHAAAPAAGTLTDTSGPLTFESGPFTVSNPTPVPEVDSGPRCSALAQCDSYELTVQLPAGYAAANPAGKIRITTSWTPAAADVDLWVYDGAVGDLDGTSGGIADGGATQANPEVVTLPLTADASHVYTLKIVPFAASGAAATTTIELDVPPPPPDDADADGIADADDQCPGTPAGTAVDSTGCPLPAGDPATCTAPGKTLLTDDELDNISATPGTDLRSFQLQQPRQAGTADRIEDQLLAFTINTDAGITPNPASSWFISFQNPSGALQGVRMTGDAAGNPVFESYYVGASGGDPPAYDGRFVDGTKAADGTSSYDSAAGRITIVVKAIDLGFTAPGQQLKSFNGGVTQTTGGVATAVDDGMPENDLARSTVDYTLHDNTACGGVQLKPVAPPAPATGLAPRFQIHVSPAGLGNDAGEPSIGYNKFSKHTMFISYVNALRQTYQEDVDPPLLPASCPAIWEDKSGLLTTANSLDPILFTDEATGRTFNSQLSGANSLFEFTDDDGENWTAGQIAIPNGGADHQTVASGPYPADATPPTASWPADGDKRAVYYCSQSVGTAFCSRSDDGGQTFGPGYTFKNLDCGVGALHGHVKVAPDGTVYVPDSSQCITAVGPTAGNVITHVSENAGLTWQVRSIPTSVGGAGSDPSIGIATDGTLYMCYENGDSTVRMAVSRDKGVTWENDRDIGAALGIVQTRFPQAIAGDGDRAACAFLGTTTPGNGSSLEFTGVWHGYIATTYDGGETYHLVNVTPGDPVQGHGGVGPDGDNRNLLDFNDLQIDDQGRLLFAFADGCIGGCVRDPAANAFAAKATIVRQTGGRTMFAKFDDVSAVTPNRRYNEETPIEPTAACARQDLSSRTPAAATVVWNEPDTGGAPITNYKVYRSISDAGPFEFLANAGSKTQYIDASADPGVERYYYRVEAQNDVDVAPVSNTVELIVSTVGDTCVLPGQIVASDATGDAQGGDDLDIVYVAVAEPEAYADSFVITLKIRNFTAGIPPATSFYVILFPLLDNLYIALDSTSGPARFVYGHFTPDPAGQGFLVYEEAGELDARSAYGADGTIAMVVPRSLMGDPAVDALIPGFDVRARIGAASANSRDTAGPGDYTVQGVAKCAQLLPVLASLDASLNEGLLPLDVTFTLSGTPPEGRTLASYSLDPGDGSAAITGSFGGSPVQVSHVYGQAGVYRALLTVTDSSGQSSTNLAEETITVLADTGTGTGGGSGGGSSDGLGNNSVGGGLPAGVLLLLGLAAALRRRR